MWMGKCKILGAVRSTVGEGMKLSIIAAVLIATATVQAGEPSDSTFERITKVHRFAFGGIQPIHGRRVAIGAYNFIGYQYTPPFVGDAFVKTDAEIEADLPLLEPLVDERTVFVTHAPALGSLDLCYEENVGSRAIAQFLERKPALAHIHGHIHEKFGRDGNHFNVAAAGVCRAMLIELPSLVHTVLAYSPNLI
jgi:hypothetical protein